MGMKTLLKLSNLKRGMSVRVVEFFPDCEECHRLLEMGLTPGTVFTVMKVAPLGDPVEIDVRGYRLCLRKKESHCLTLEIADELE